MNCVDAREIHARVAGRRSAPVGIKKAASRSAYCRRTFSTLSSESWEQLIVTKPFKSRHHPRGQPHSMHLKPTSRYKSQVDGRYFR